MFRELEKINQRPKPFEFYTTPLLWNDPYVSKQMLKYHLDENIDLASRPKAFIQKSVEWMSKLFGIGADSAICDFGCGPGLYTTRFAQKGAHVVGIDLSENSIRYAQEEAKKEHLPIRYLLQNYLEYEPKEQFDLITMIFCDYSTLNHRQRKKLLRVFYESLKENGKLLFDVFSIGYFVLTQEKRAYEYVTNDGFWSKDPYYAFTNTFKYEKEKLILDKHTIVDAKGTKEIFNWLQCYTSPALEKELVEAGFRLRETYADVAGTPYREGTNEFAIVAGKAV